jgi:hypothetical protein
MDIGNLQTAKAIWDISGCYEGDPLACASVLIAASEQHEKTANEKISNTQLFATSTPSPTFTPISTPTQTLTPAPAYPTLYADQNYLCLEGPGRSYPHAHDILMGTSYQIIGRSSNGWYQIAISFANTHHTSCWIGGGIVSGNINTIPVVEVAPPNSICGWIENSTDTGGWIGTLTVSGTGEVIQLAGVDDTAFNAIVANPLPGNFRIYDPVYHSTDNLSSFSKIEPVSSCP